MNQFKTLESCIVHMHDDEVEFLHPIGSVFVPSDFFINLAYILEECELPSFICEFSGCRITLQEVREISSDYLIFKI